MRQIFSLPLVLGALLIGVLVFSPMVPPFVVEVLFSVSSVIKELLEFILPFMIIFFVLSGITSFRQRSAAILLVLILLVFVSNALTSMYTYGVLQFVLPLFKGVSVCDLATTSSIKPLWSLGLIKILPAEASLVLSLISGILLSWWPVPSIITFVAYGRRYIEWFLQSVFVPLLPLYVLGFFLKIAHEMPFQALCGAYGIVFAVAVVAQISYLIFSYLVANGFLLSRVVETFMVAFPSYLTAFGTMSSVAALPVSVVAAEKNVKSRSLADVAMPIFANVHLMGDAVAVPLFAVVTMQLFLGVVPTFTTYLIFVGYFCLSMLAVSGIPGGGIIVMLPLFKSLLGFTPEMLGIMTALYLLQDAFGTAANVMGDGALIIVLKKILKTFHLIKDSHE